MGDFIYNINLGLLRFKGYTKTNFGMEALGLQPAFTKSVYGQVKS